MGLDGLGSSAYGPEAALTVLLPLGALGLSAVGPIMLLLVALLAVLYVSYRQTVLAYPSQRRRLHGVQGQPRHGREPARRRGPDGRLRAERGGGHLGRHRRADLGRARARPLHAGAVPRRAGGADAGEPARYARRRARSSRCPPTCSSPASSCVIALGAWATWRAAATPCRSCRRPPLPAATETLGLWLFLRAFAAGCTAMTGVEAVSNGVSAFRQPVVARAHNTLTVIVVTLGFLLLGIGYLARAYGIGAMDQSGPATRACCRSSSAPWRAAAGSTTSPSAACCASCACRPTPASSTSRACAGSWREDGFLPRPFAVAGRRLVYSVGVLYLAGDGGAAARRLRRHHRPADPALRHRRLPDLHAVAGRHGGALVARGRAPAGASASTRSAPPPRAWRCWSSWPPNSSRAPGSR